MKPYYEHGGITIYHGDCRDVLPSLVIGAADSVITDPPYGMGKDFQNDDPATADVLVAWAMTEARRIVDGGNVVAFWSAQRLSAIEPVFSPKRVMVWNKTWAIHAPGNVGFRYEPIVWVAGRSANHKRGDVFECFPIIRKVQRESVGHPTQKPQRLMRELIRDFSCSVVLDPFMGSGSTVVAAQIEKRGAIGIEIDERYCEIAAKRLEQEVLPLEAAV